MARIYKAHKKRNGDQVWGIDFVDPSRTRVRRVVGTQTQARVMLARVLTEMDDNAYAKSGRKGMTFAELRALWFEHRAEKRSIATDRHRWDWIIKGLGEKRRIDQVTTTDIIRFRTWLREQTVLPRKSKKKSTKPTRLLSAAAVNRVVQLLRAAYNFACRLPSSERPVKENPVALIRRLREPARRDRICSEDELQLLLGDASPKLALAISIAYEVGPRESEIAKLTWDRFDLKNLSFRLVDTKHSGEQAKDRTIAISAHLAEMFRAWPRKIKDTRIVGLRADNISSMFRRLVLRLGIENLRFHDLRHTAATNLRRAGVDIITIKAMLGHASWQACEIYQTVTVDDMHAALSKRDDRGMPQKV